MEVREASAKYLRTTGYKQTEVGLIPEDWTVANLSLVSKEPMQNGLFFKPSHKGSGIKLINVGDLYASVPINSDDLELFAATDDERKRFKVEDGDIFFTRSSVVPYGIAHCNIYLSRYPESIVFDSHVIRIRPDPKKVAPSFLFRFAVSLMARRYLVAHSKTATMTTIDQGVLGRCPVLLPPIAEQEAIAEALSDADALIESLERLLAKKRHLKQGAMQQLLTGKKRLPGFSGEWEVKQLGDVVEKFVGGGTPSRSNPQYWGDEIPWVTVKDFATFNPRQSQEAITKAGLQNSASHLIPRGTLITSTRMALGKAVIYEVDVAINQDLKALFTKPDLAMQYLYYWFQYHGQSIDDLGSGSTVKGVSLPDLKKIEFQLPLIPEQTAIATILSDMDADIAALGAKLTKARGLKQGMMQELLTGRIRLV